MTADAPSSRLQFLVPVGGLLFVVLIFVILHLLRGEETAPEPVDRAAAWLAARQRSDGSWRSEEVSILRPGPAMTAFIMFGLNNAPPSIRSRHAETLKRATRYLESSIGPDGIVGMGPDGADFPNYATSLTVLALVSAKPAGWESSVSRMVDYLKKAQLDESEGWSPQDPEYGGWAFGGPPQPKPYAHRLDISMTRFALEALGVARVPADDPVWGRARRFLETCQNEDGGFRFTPLPGQNKAGDGVSYGSATADGMVALHYAGGGKDRIDAAARWIKARFSTKVCPGFSPNEPRPWAQGLRGYWWAVAGRVAPLEWNFPLKSAIIGEQRPDGSWVNSVDIMQEHEPLLATALALIALVESDRMYKVD